MQTKSEESTSFYRITGFAEECKSDGEQIVFCLQRRGNRLDSFVLPEAFFWPNPPESFCRSHSFYRSRSFDRPSELFVLPKSFVLPESLVWPDPRLQRRANRLKSLFLFEVCRGEESSWKSREETYIYISLFSESNPNHFVEPSSELCSTTTLQASVRHHLSVTKLATSSLSFISLRPLLKPHKSNNHRTTTEGN